MDNGDILRRFALRRLFLNLHPFHLHFPPDSGLPFPDWSDRGKIRESAFILTLIVLKGGGGVLGPAMQKLVKRARVCTRENFFLYFVPNRK